MLIQMDIEKIDAEPREGEQDADDTPASAQWFESK